MLNQHRLVVDAALLRCRSEGRAEVPVVPSAHSHTRDRGALRHDDRLDALAIAVAYWMEYLDRDVTDEENKRMQELWDVEYAKFEESVFGRRPAPPNFFDNY